jgi:hypothetical protein
MLACFVNTISSRTNCFCVEVSAELWVKLGVTLPSLRCKLFLWRGNLVMKGVDVFTVWFVVLAVQCSGTLIGPEGWSSSETLHNFALVTIRYRSRLPCLIKQTAHKTSHLLYLAPKILTSLRVSVTERRAFYTNLVGTQSRYVLLFFVYLRRWCSLLCKCIIGHCCHARL